MANVSNLLTCLCGLLLTFVVYSKSTDGLNKQLIISIQKEFCEYETKGEKTKESDNTDLPDNVRMSVDVRVKPPEWPASTCCRSCSYDLDCVRTDTCCPDLIDKLPQVSTRTACVQPQLRPSVKSKPTHTYNNSPIEYLMLRGCSIGQDEVHYNATVTMMCKRPDDYKNLDSKVPVTDLRSGMTYTNRFCALCNGLSETDFVYWNPEIICGNDSIAEFNIETIVEEVIKTDTCNLIFKAPVSITDIVNAYECTDYISECNVTGQLAYYDLFIEKACHAYSQLYNYRYKNIFCYFCNTENATGPTGCSPGRHGSSDIVNPWMGVSFSALLRFRPGEKYPPRGKAGHSSCEPNQMFDWYKEVCRNITCFPPRLLVEDACSNPYSTISGVIYRFFFKFIPQVDLHPEEISRLPADLFTYSRHITSSFNIPAQYVMTGMYSKISSGEKKNGITTPDYFLVHIDVTLKLGFSVNVSSVDNLVLLDNTTVMIKTKANYEIPFQAFLILANLSKTDGKHVYDSIQDEMLYEVYTDRNEDKTDSLDEDSVEANDNSTRVKDDDEENNTTGDEDGDIVNHIEVIIPPKFCPLIALKTDEFHFTWYNWGVYVHQLETNISRNEFVHIYDKAGNGTVFVCRHLFKKITDMLLLRYPKPSPRTPPQVILSLICTCLSVLCSAITLITYMLFAELRTQPGMNNVMLIISLICSQLLFQFGIGQAVNVNDKLCEALGILVHFSWLVTLMWMNICSLHMFRVFRSLTQISGRESLAKVTLVYIAYSIVAAAVPVILNVIVSQYIDGNIGYGGGLCYITHYKMIGYFFAIPVGLVVVVDLILFLSVIIIISKLPKIDGNTSKNRNFAQIYAKVSTLTGMTWIFGFVFTFTDVEFLEYVFIILNAGLGVFIFLSFVCNKRVLTLYSRMLKSKKAKYTEATGMSRIGNRSDSRTVLSETDQNTE